MAVLLAVLDVVTTRDVLQWALTIIGTLFGVVLFLLKREVDSIRVECLREIGDLRKEVENLRAWRHDVREEAHRQLWIRTYGEKEE